MGRRVHPRGGLGSLPRRQISKMAGQGSRSGRRHAPRPRDHRGSQPRIAAPAVSSASASSSSSAGAALGLSAPAGACFGTRAGIRVCRVRASSWHRGPRSCGSSCYRRAVRVGRRLLFVSRGAAAVAASSGPRGARRPVACLRYKLAQPTITGNTNQNTLGSLANQNTAKYFRFSIKTDLFLRAPNQGFA